MVTTACSETATPARDASNDPPAVEVIAAEPVPETAPATAEIGYYTIGDARVTLADALVLPGEPGEVTLMLTPTALTAEERVAVLASATWPGMPLMDKRTADYPDRYPFVTVKLSYQGTLAPANVRNYYVMAYGIAEPNHTDNINGLFGFPGDKARLGRLQQEGDRVWLKFSGEQEINGEPRSWAFDIPG